jgi:ketosteroid isomerase-like protein
MRSRSSVIAMPALAVLSLAIMAAAPASPPRTSGQRASSKTPLQSLVTAEKTFAKLSVDQGMRTAFLANLADDGVVFRPLAVNGKESWTARPESKAVLAWAPAHAEVAGSADLGFTSGPWEYTPAPSGAAKQKVYGTFLSVWRRDRGDWKLVADLGVSHDKLVESLANVPFQPGPTHVATDSAATPMDPLTLDRVLSNNLASLGALYTFSNWLARDFHYLTDGAAPRTGSDGAAALAATAARSRWIPSGGGVALAGDLGYTYGVRQDSTAVAGGAPDTTVYLHVWRRMPKESWRIAAAVENPLHTK